MSLESYSHSAPSISLSRREVFDETVPNQKHSKQTCKGKDDDTEQVSRNVDPQDRRLTF
jgi:hypothetical protein